MQTMLCIELYTIGTVLVRLIVDEFILDTGNYNAKDNPNAKALLLTYGDV